MDWLKLTSNRRTLPYQCIPLAGTTIGSFHLSTAARYQLVAVSDSVRSWNNIQFSSVQFSSEESGLRYLEKKLIIYIHLEVMGKGFFRSWEIMKISE